MAGHPLERFRRLVSVQRHKRPKDPRDRIRVNPRPSVVTPRGAIRERITITRAWNRRPGSSERPTAVSSTAAKAAERFGNAFGRGAHFIVRGKQPRLHQAAAIFVSLRVHSWFTRWKRSKGTTDQRIKGPDPCESASIRGCHLAERYGSASRIPSLGTEAREVRKGLPPFPHPRHPRNPRLKNSSQGNLRFRRCTLLRLRLRRAGADICCPCMRHIGPF